MQRRIFLKGGLAAGAAGLAAGLVPQAALAAWSKEAFENKDMKGALTALFGSDATSPGQVKIKAPDIAENGAVVPITVSADIDGAEAIAIFATKNNFPLTSEYVLGEGALPFVSTRIKMGKTADVVAVVKAGGKLYSAKKAVKVTIGGCGG